MRLQLVIATAAATCALAHTASAMTSYQWKKRPVVVFAPTDQHPGFIRQKAIVGGNRVGLMDRDVVVVYVTGGAVSHDLGSGPGMSAAALRTRFKTSEGVFRVLLVGKDGAVKLDSPKPIEASDLLADIDRMPMRRDEIRRREVKP